MYSPSQWETALLSNAISHWLGAYTKRSPSVSLDESSCNLVSWNCINSLPVYLMITSSNGNFFRVTVLLCGEFPGPRLIPRTKASDVELWCFLWSAPETRLSKQSWDWWFETPSRPLWRHCNAYFKYVPHISVMYAVIIRLILRIDLNRLMTMWKCRYIWSSTKILSK